MLRTYIESEKGGYVIYLLDSDQRKIYKATCNKIKFDRNKDIPSPDESQTPDYYKNQKYAAWFYFSDIDECDLQEIRQFSYVEVDSLFVDSNTNYHMFSEKRIYNIDELIQQNRTVWFVRKFEEKDLDHEIVLLNANITEPADFSKRFFETGSNSILWLSDLHLDDTSPFFVKKGKNPNTITLTEHIKQSYENFSDIGGLVITGDITNCGKAEGFDAAQNLIKDLSGSLSHSLTSESILFCPGNHDFSRKEEELGDNPPELISNQSKSTEDYAKFYHQVHSKFPNEYFACGRKFLMSSGRTVEIASLNSLMLQQYKDFEGHGFLSQKQLDFVAKEMGWDERNDTNTIRIAIMHHHYLPTCFVEKIDTKKASSVVYDAERLMEWLDKYNVRILLHGHKHRNFAATVGLPSQTKDFNCDFSGNRQTFVIGMGGTGAVNCNNMYAIIQFLSTSIKINFYRIFSDNIQKDCLDHIITIPI